jgi:hypothetical protein
MKKQFLLLVATVLVITLNSFSQSNMNPDSLTINAMDKLSFLTGDWTGEGWIQMGREKHHFSQSETVTQKVNNTVIVIDGQGIDSETKKIIHQAFAVISFDKVQNKYLMRAFRADGNYIDAVAKVDENGSFVWGFTHPQAGKMRYTISINDGNWVETGEMSRDGNNWFQFFEMTLSKQ